MTLYRSSPYTCHHHSPVKTAVPHNEPGTSFWSNAPSGVRVKRLGSTWGHDAACPSRVGTILARLAGLDPLMCTPRTSEGLMIWTTLALTLLVDQGPTARILALFTCRPDFSPPWTGRSHLTRVTVHRLPRRQAVEVVRQVAHGQPLPSEVVEQIVARSAHVAVAWTVTAPATTVSEPCQGAHRCCVALAPDENACTIKRFNVGSMAIIQNGIANSLRPFFRF
jgi:hypothetical protein